MWGVHPSMLLHIVAFGWILKKNFVHTQFTLSKTDLDVHYLDPLNKVASMSNGVHVRGHMHV